MVEWRVAPRFPNYEASSLGEVRSVPREETVRRKSGTYVRLRKGKLLKPTLHHSGYLCINTSNDGKAKMVGVHQLVADAFIGERPHDMDVNHINGNKCDNRHVNLEYMTNRENMLHGYRTGLINNRGETNGSSKLKPDAVLLIRDLRGKKAPLDVAAEFGISREHVYDIWNRKAWKHLQ